MNSRQLSMLAPMLVFMAVIAALGTLAPGAAPHVPFQVTCTTGMVADIVRQVAGDKAEVTNIIGEGVDPHLYRPTRADIARMLSADIVFYNGLMLEGKMAGALEKISASKPVLAFVDGVDGGSLLKPPGLDGHADPHLWMDVGLWKQCAEFVARELCRFDSANTDYYRGNFDRYLEQLQRLDRYARESLASIPERSRVLVTAHDAFHYLGRAYGLEVRGIQGISTESEAGIADVNELVDLLVAQQVKAIFVETSVSDKNVRALIESAAAQGHTVSIGGALFSDAMGAPGTYEGTYIGMIDHNVTVIAEALGGDVPKLGLNELLSR